MRILHVMETPGQGSGRHVIDLVEGMRDRGHELHVVYSAVRANPNFRCELEALGGTRVRVSEIAMYRRPGLRDLASLLSLYRYIRKHGPFDVVHGHSSKAGALARLAASSTGGLRFYTPNALVTLDPMLGAWERRFYSAVELWLSRISDGIIAVSPEEHAAALALGIEERRVFLILSGVKAPVGQARAVARERLSLSENLVCAGFVGRLTRQKAPERLMAAFAEAASRRPNLRLLIVGDGDLMAMVQEMAMRLRVEHKVIWTGEVDSSEVFTALDIFVLPSRFEGLSYSTMEAMGFGIPVVTTDTGGARVLVEDGVTGFIVVQNHETQIIADLAAALASLTDDATMRRAMATAAMAKSHEFRASRMVEEVLELYGRLRRSQTAGLP
ncbi:MAG: glycosyl transferase group 1 family protein [Rhodospirillales bacterium]|jgi:glycosyltransferase involved in cell wall biosynthesis|nr:glycosyl transferase group 1 family protein [Rhodospirillales bacterium]